MSLKIELSPKIYVKRAEFIDELKLSQDKGEPTDNLVKILMNIAFRSSTHYFFYKYTFREDMIMEAVERMLTKVNNFDLSRGSSPLAFFTQICWNQFKQCINREYRQNNIKRAFSEESWNNHCQDFDINNAYANLPTDEIEYS